MATATIRALGGAEVTVAFTTRWAVNLVAAKGVIAPALATNDAVSATEAGIVPPLLTLRAHGDDVFVDPSQTHAETTGGKTNRSAHEGLTNSARPVVLDGNGDNMGRAERFILSGNETRKSPDGNLGPGRVGPDVL